MLKLTTSVGKGAPNQAHDVALVQAALANIPASSTSPFGPKLWTRGFDGQSSPKLEQSIALFQSNNRIPNSGRIDPFGPVIQALDRALPPDRKGLAVVENCTAVLCSAMNVSSINQALDALRNRTLLPGPVAVQLADVVRNLHKQNGLVLRPDGHGIDQQGRLVQKLAFADTHWMNGSGQFTPQAPMDKVGQVVATLRRRPLPALLEWHGGPMPFGDAPVHAVQRVGNMIGSGGGGSGAMVLAVRARERLRCLSGMPRPLDPDRLHRLGLARTGDAVADRMLDVAATEIEAGNAGANELGILTDMFKGIFDSAANGIQRASSSAGHSAQFIESVDKVIGLMASNLASSAIRELRSLTQEARPGMAVGEGAMLGNILDARRKAWNKLTELAGNGRPWDIKRQFPEWSFDPVSNRSFFRDIWGNVHFGYLGLAAGFSEVELFSGAGRINSPRTIKD